MIRMEKRNDEFKKKLSALEQLRDSDEVRLADYADSVVEALNDALVTLRAKYRIGTQLMEEGITRETLTEVLSKLEDYGDDF